MHGEGSFARMKSKHLEGQGAECEASRKGCRNSVAAPRPPGGLVTAISMTVYLHQHEST